MRRTIVILAFALMCAGCGENNPVAPVAKTIHSGNLQITFSIPQPLYGPGDTLRATTTVYNSGDSAVTLYVPVCWPIARYSVKDAGGITEVSYSAPRNLGCNSIVEYSVRARQIKEISLLSVVVPILELDKTRNAQGSYVLTVDDDFGTFALNFMVN